MGLRPGRAPPLPMQLSNMDHPENKPEIIPNNGNCEKKLSAKEQRFVDEYCSHWNGAEAARQVGYSPKYAGVIACQMLSKTHIKHAVDARMAILSQKCEITSIELTKRIDELYTKTGKDEERKGWNPHIAAKCLEMHGKHIGHFEADNAQRGVQVLINSNIEQLEVSAPVALVHSDSPSPRIKGDQDVIEGEIAPTDEDNQT